MPIDDQRLNLCLVETEQELIRVGRERHDFLQQQSQEAALILLLLRCCSLFRAMLSSLQRQELDAFDAVRRAYLETWHLAFQFRMPTLRGQAGRWLARQPNSWSADIGALEEYARGRGAAAFLGMIVPCTGFTPSSTPRFFAYVKMPLSSDFACWSERRPQPFPARV
jgi:hypothetical protein